MKNTASVIASLVLFLTVSAVVVFGFFIVPKDFMTAYKMGIICLTLFSAVSIGCTALVKYAITNR